jgi:hypothetical protein
MAELEEQQLQELKLPYLHCVAAACGMLVKYANMASSILVC